MVRQWDPLAWGQAGRWHRLNPGTDLEDWYRTAVAALWDAATRFQPGRGFKFSTYAHRYLLKWLHPLASNEAGRGQHVPQHHGVKRIPVEAFGGITGEEGDGDFAATVPGREADPREVPPDAAEFWAAVAGVVTDDRELLVLRRRLVDGKKLAEVGAELGVHRRTARLIEARAMARLAERKEEFARLLDGRGPAAVG